MRYPDIPRPNSGYNFRSNRPLVTAGPEWAPQSRALTRFNLCEADLTYKAKSIQQAMVLYNFFESVDGAAGRFTFVDFNGIGPVGGSDPGVMWQSMFVAQGNGAVTNWDAPTFSLKANLTTIALSITAGTRTVTPASMTAITEGGTLTIVNADGTQGEIVTVTAVTFTTFTAVFVNSHAVNSLVGAPLVFEDGVAKTTTVTASPSAGNYGVAFGTGTDGVDKVYAGTAPASAVIVSMSGFCRRAMRRARFIQAKNPFLYEVPAIYSQGPVTIAEVRR